MKKSSYKNELDEHESVRIQKTGEKKSTTEGWIKLLLFFAFGVNYLQYMFLIYNLFFHCIFIHCKGALIFVGFFAATATQILKYNIRYTHLITNY